MTTPKIGSTVYVVRLKALSYADHDLRFTVAPMRVVSAATPDGFLAGERAKTGAWPIDVALLLDAEGVLWTRVADAEAHQALLAAHALYLTR